MSLFKELKRRNVFKVTIAYIALAWLVLQVADVILNNITAPDWIFGVLLLFLAIGLPFAVFFAWAYELTPEGLKRDYEVDRTRSTTPQAGTKLNVIVFAAMALALSYFAYDKFVLDASRDAALVESVRQEATEQSVAAESDNSIAVLPFVNMSSDEEQEYFSDGLSEELLNMLTKISGLRVAARTSSFSFKDQNLEIPEIAKRLKVTHILEGSVRKAGDQIRITAQLIKADDGYHLWSESYERQLDDIFAIQDDIAAEVVTQLKVKLLGELPMAEETDPNAYALYLQARQLNHQQIAAAIEQSIALHERVLAIDPHYTAAWVGLADNYRLQSSNGWRPIDEGFGLAREAAYQALTINPDSAPALAILGQIASEYDNDLATAAKYYMQALALAPANPDILLATTALLRGLCRVEDLIILLEYLVARDPVNPRVHANLAASYLSYGRPDAAITSYRTGLNLSPGFAGSQSGIGLARLFQGDPEAALLAIKQEKTAWKWVYLPIVYHALGRQEESDAALAELIEKYSQYAAYNIAYVMAFRGEADRAFEWLDKAVQYKDPGLIGVTCNRLFSNIHDDPRWLPFLESIGRSPRKLAAIDFQVTLPE